MLHLMFEDKNKQKMKERKKEPVGPKLSRQIFLKQATQGKAKVSEMLIVLTAPPGKKEEGRKKERKKERKK